MLVYLSDRVVTNNRHAMNCTRKAFTVSTLSALVHSTHLSSSQWLCDKQSVVLQSEWELKKLAFNSFPSRMGKSSYVQSYCAPTIRVVSVSWHTDMQRLARKVGRVKHWKLQAGLIFAKQPKRGWPTFEKVFDAALAETPTHEVCTHRVVCHFLWHPATRHKKWPSQLRAEFPLLTSRAGSGHGTVLKLGPRITWMLRPFSVRCV